MQSIYPVEIGGMRKNGGRKMNNDWNPLGGMIKALMQSIIITSKKLTYMCGMQIVWLNSSWAFNEWQLPIKVSH